MSTSTAAVRSSTNVATTPQFWERLWRTAGMQSVGLFVVAYFVYGDQPHVGASPEALVAFFQGDRIRILIAAVVGGFAVLNLMWFAAALRATLAQAGQDGWGAAATASSAALGGLLMLLITVSAALGYSIAGSGAPALLGGLSDLYGPGVVLSSFPRAMLIMSAAFGLWRAGLISNRLFAVGVAAVVLVLLGGTTWVSGGFWAPDGVFSRVRFAAYRPSVDCGRQPRSLDPQSSYARRMVIAPVGLRTEPRNRPGSYAKKFSGKYQHRAIDGGVGHNLPRRKPPRLSLKPSWTSPANQHETSSIPATETWEARICNHVSPYLPR